MCIYSEANNVRLEHIKYKSGLNDLHLALQNKYIICIQINAHKNDQICVT